ncbi:LuxR C-terminal-related transcriptional regulator [Variovorax sp. H27-G14]|uniref:response regulator transcription factor n=1 Tax=Variovorax sp. H27-G14 TaxID=3111914 RepID=UPI0038FD3811
MSKVRIQRVATQLASSNRTPATTRMALEAMPLRSLAKDAAGRGKIARRSLGVKRWEAQARIVALRERSRRIDQLCVLAASPLQASPSASSAAFPAREASALRVASHHSDEALVRTLADDVQPVNSAVAASAVGALFIDANEVELAFLMRLIAEGDTATASRIARRIVGVKQAAVAHDGPQILQMSHVPRTATAQPDVPAQVHEQQAEPAPSAKARRARATPPAGADHARGALSPRELNVLRMISQGLSNRQIAEQSYRSLHTVDAQVKNIYRKLAVNTRAQAVREAMQAGLINLEDACGG